MNSDVVCPHLVITQNTAMTRYYYLAGWRGGEPGGSVCVDVVC